MRHYWLRTIIRMLNIVEEQLTEFVSIARQEGAHKEAYKGALYHLKQTVRELNEHYDALQTLERP